MLSLKASGAQGRARHRRDPHVDRAVELARPAFAGASTIVDERAPFSSRRRAHRGGSSRALARSGLLTVLALLLAIIDCTHFHARARRRRARGSGRSPALSQSRHLQCLASQRRIDDIAKFLSDTDADLVVMQEMTADNWSKLREVLGSAIPIPSAMSAS